MRLLYWLAAVFLTALTVSGSEQWCDDPTGTCFEGHYFNYLDMRWGYLFPPVGQYTDEFIGIYIAPTSSGWIGGGLLGGMLNALLIIGWTHEGQAILTSRWTDGYRAPSLYPGPRFTVLETSGVSGDRMRLVFRCQNCTSWSTGSIPDGQTTFAFAGQKYANWGPLDPANPNSDLLQHTAAGRFGMNITASRSANYGTFLENFLSNQDSA